MKWRRGSGLDSFFNRPLTTGLFDPVLDLQYEINPGMFRFSRCVPHFKFEARLSVLSSLM
jgi:hypothetical protein